MSCSKKEPNVKLRLSVLGALTAFFSTMGSAEAQPLTVDADEWPPFSGSSLPGLGLSLDVITEVLTQAGYDVEPQVVPWARIMNGAESGEFDIIGSLFYDPGLENNLTYSDPYFHTDVLLVQRSGDTKSYSTVDALRPYSIAVGDGFLYQEEFDQADYLNKITVTTTLQAIQMVAFERADLTLDSVDVVNYALSEEDPSLRGKVEIAPGVLASQGIHMAVRNDLEGRDALIADFNRTLESMISSGALSEILAKHVER
jgi:polar amino acid transport system substrate-binding protein